MQPTPKKPTINYQELSVEEIVLLSQSIKQQVRDSFSPSVQAIHAMMETMEKHGFIRIIDLIKTMANLDEALMYAEAFEKKYTQIKQLLASDEFDDNILEQINTLVGENSLFYRALWKKAAQEQDHIKGECFHSALLALTLKNEVLGSNLLELARREGLLEDL